VGATPATCHRSAAEVEHLFYKRAEQKKAATNAAQNNILDMMHGDNIRQRRRFSDVGTQPIDMENGYLYRCNS
jgi:hypothetical protein